jgi:DNA-binding MltR family transcriptional regulator
MAKNKRIIETPETLSSEQRIVYDALNGESDIGCVIISAAFLDDVLASILKTKLLESEITDNLLSGAIGTFSARGDMAYCLQLIDKNEYKDLRKIEEIRNLFAHSRFNMTFDNHKVQGLCQEFCSINFFISHFGSDVENPTKQDLCSDARNRFNFAIVNLSTKSLLKGLELKQKV